MPQWLRHQLFIVAVAVPVLFVQLGTARLWDRDEPRNAQCAVEMSQRADWVVPVFNDELRAHKPVLLYWLIMSAYAVFGVNEFAARFWSAALGVATVLCTYHLGARLFNRTAGLWAALSLAPALMFAVASRAATPDAPLIFCVTAALCAYVQFAFPASSSVDGTPRFPQSLMGGLVIHGLVALAVLAKGPVGFVLPAAIIGLSLWMTRVFSLSGLFTAANPHDTPTETRFYLRVGFTAPLKNLWTLIIELQPLTSLAMLLIVALPWYAWVGWRTNGEFLVGFLWDHNVRRATESMEGHSGPAILFYPLTLMIGFFPASVFLLPALLDARRQLNVSSRQTAAIVFCVTWIVVVIGLFSVAKTKLPSYVTPCYPALAVLVGSLLERWTARKLAISSHWLRLSVAVNVLVGIVAVVAVYVLAGRYLPGEQWLAAIGLVLIAGGGVALYCEWRQHSSLRAATISLGSGLLFSCLAFGLIPAAADRHQQSHELLAAVRDRAPTEIAALRCLEPSWVFYLGRPIRQVEEADEAAAFLAQNDRLLIVCDDDYASLAGRLPPDVQVLHRTPRFLRSETLLVLGRTHTSLAEKPNTESHPK